MLVVVSLLQGVTALWLVLTYTELRVGS